MDISLKLKRAVAIVSTFALVLANAPFALAQTFGDVTTNAWYYQYVEDGVDQGIFDVADSFRPNDALNRAELTKIVITAIDGLAGYEAPATPTFDDVATDAWFYDYVEAAVQLDIVNGYTDASGNLTGQFGPGDTVNRAAATKILVNAFGIPTDLSPASSFADVSSGAWYHDFVVTAYNQSVLDGYQNGNFGPADPVTRAQVAKLVQTAQNPVERQVADSGDDDQQDTASEGDLEVSLNDNTPKSSTMPQSATNVSLLSVDFTAADDDVKLTNLVVTRGGVGNASDFENVYVYDGAKRVTTGRTLNSDTNKASFPLTVTVPAGTTKTLRVVGEVASSASANNQHFFYLASASSITSNAQATAGDFPVTGNTFTTGSVSVNSVTVNKGTEISQPKVGGSNQEVSAFKLQAGSNNDVAIHQVGLTQNGSLSSSKLENLKLLRGTDVVATAEGFDGDLVTFVLDTPFVIPEGQSRNFYVRADIDGGRTTDTVEFYLDENTDLVAIDQQYGFGATITNSDFTVAGVTATGLEGSGVTITDNGPAATQIAQNTTNVELLNYSITADRDVRVKDTDLRITLSGDAGAGPNLQAIGDSIVEDGNVAATAASATGGDLNLTADTAGTGANGYQVIINAGGADTTGVVVNSSTSSAITITVEDDGAGAADPTWTDIKAALDGNATSAAIIDVATTNGGDTFVTADAETLTLSGGTNSTIASLCIDDDAASHTAGITDGDTISIPTASGTVYTIVTATAGNGCNGGTDTLITTNETATTAATNGGTVQEVNPYSLVKNVKIVDLDSGATLQGPITEADDGTANFNLDPVVAGPPDFYTKQLTEDYNLTGGDARHLSVQADLDQNIPDGYTLTARIDYNTLGYIKDDAANENVALAEIVGGQLTGKSHTTANNSLTIAASSVPVSNTFVKGSDNVAGLGISLTAGDAGPIVIKKLDVNLYADSAASGWGSNTGDIAANTLVSSVTLYDGDDIVAGPESITLVDANSSGFTADADYYKADFDNLNINIPAGGTDTLVAKVKLLNTTSTTSYLALDVAASTITAEDSEANSITAQGGNINQSTSPNPVMTILNSGTLTAFGEGSPQAQVLVTGQSDQLVAKYRFNALREAFTVKKLTVINDTTGAFNSATSTTAASQVKIRYTDVNGVQKTKSASLANGSATFSALDFYVPKDGDAFLEILADTTSRTAGGEQISGKTLRLGIKDTNNTVTSFEAVGTSSSVAEYFNDDTTDDNTNDGTDITNAIDVKPMVLRKSKPTFAKASGLVTNITGTDDVLYGLTVTADSNGPVSFGRLSFVVTENVTGGNSALDTFKFFDGSTLLDTEANIYVAGGADAKLAGTDVTGTATIIVSFNQEETINAGASKTYYLKARVDATPSSNETISTTLASGDETVPLTGFTTNTNANTAKISSAAGATGIFTGATEFRNTTTATGGGTEVANIIWSDKSADAHSYPTVASGSVTAESGSYDWTNGYLLKATSVVSHTLTK